VHLLWKFTQTILFLFLPISSPHPIPNTSRGIAKSRVKLDDGPRWSQSQQHFPFLCAHFVFSIQSAAKKSAPMHSKPNPFQSAKFAVKSAATAKSTKPPTNNTMDALQWECEREHELMVPFPPSAEGGGRQLLAIPFLGSRSGCLHFLHGIAEQNCSFVLRSALFLNVLSLGLHSTFFE
jgi:hypothetical protein